jgi:hypothetical protein
MENMLVYMAKNWKVKLIHEEKIRYEVLEWLYMALYTVHKQRDVNMIMIMKLKVLSTELIPT